jgi:Domain of unknown function (DUF4383)
VPQPQSLLNVSPEAATAGGGRWRGRTLAQWYCLIVGVLLGLRGAQQFVVGVSFAAPGDGWRASQQLLTAMLLLAAQRNRSLAYWALIPFAIYYAIVSVVGDINGHEAFGLLPVDGRDLFAHPIYAVSSGVIVLLGARRLARDRAGVPAERR